jgi:hypothetical protein
MQDQDWLAERFEADRAHLRGVAFRMASPSTIRTRRPRVGSSSSSTASTKPAGEPGVS